MMTKAIREMISTTCLPWSADAWGQEDHFLYDAQPSSAKERNHDR